MSTRYYRVQVGAFQQVDNAKRLMENLKAKGFKPVVVTTDDYFKIQVGAFTKLSNAQKRLDELHKAGFFTALIMTADNKVVTDYHDIIKVLNSWCERPDARKIVYDIIIKHGYKTDIDHAWCVETIVAAILEVGGKDLLNKLVGGFTTWSRGLKKRAKELGTYHSGSKGIQAGDIVLYGKGDVPNHSEFAIDSSYNISGNYKRKGDKVASVHKRKRNGRIIHGYIRPRY